MVSPEIKFINHASVLISYNNIHLLSDPWYEGSAFNNGWKLIYENDNNHILKLIKNQVTHIWISHEHPDHFSIEFFRKYKEIIISKNIEILFQETKDQRVISYLIKNNFRVKELRFKKFYNLTNDFDIKCIKDGFYDSALLACCGNKKILNLNDCQINTKSRGNQIKRQTGAIDLLLTQFSYAAWKGGYHNKDWRTKAAKDKISSMRLQIECLKPKYVIPFASYIYFCNKDNSYMNDSINTPRDVFKNLKNLKSSILIMKPNEIFNFKGSKENKFSFQFWDQFYDDIHNKSLLESKIINYKELLLNFDFYRKRILKSNNLFLMKLIYYFSPISFFKPVCIFLEDLEKTLEIDYIKNRFRITTKKPILAMKSESLLFIFKNQFGFDTLNVNSRFEEVSKSGWSKAARSLTIETLNNMGFRVNILLFFNRKIIFLFFKTLLKVNRNLKN